MAGLLSRRSEGEAEMGDKAITTLSCMRRQCGTCEQYERWTVFLDEPSDPVVLSAISQLHREIRMQSHLAEALPEDLQEKFGNLMWALSVGTFGTTLLAAARASWSGNGSSMSLCRGCLIVFIILGGVTGCRFPRCRWRMFGLADISKNNAILPITRSSLDHDTRRFCWRPPCQRFREMAPASFYHASRRVEHPTPPSLCAWRCSWSICGGRGCH